MAIIFVVLLTVIIAKVVVPRFEETYKERTEAIQGGMEKAEKVQAEAQAALQQYQAYGRGPLRGGQDPRGSQDPRHPDHRRVA